MVAKAIAASKDWSWNARGHLLYGEWLARLGHDGEPT
jgi:hypothetical protein